MDAGEGDIPVGQGAGFGILRSLVVLERGYRWGRILRKLKQANLRIWECRGVIPRLLHGIRRGALSALAWSPPFVCRPIEMLTMPRRPASRPVSAGLDDD